MTDFERYIIAAALDENEILLFIYYYTNLKVKCRYPRYRSQGNC